MEFIELAIIGVMCIIYGITMAMAKGIEAVVKKIKGQTDKTKEIKEV